MSFTYSTIGLGLGVAQITANGKIGGSLTGISIGTVTQTQKVWRSFQALGDIAFAYSYSIILIEIQDTLKSPPSEAKTMKKATLVSVSVTTLFYMLCGAAGYAPFGHMAPGNLLTGFGIPIEMSLCVESMLPFDFATSSTSMTLMLSISPLSYSYGWLLEGSNKLDQ
ncbi:amino acid permease 3-like [Cucumis melo]|uniref:Amino acid permease 3-like n=1 Tax=Cucumis melo TaxID=3656 RepID=A0ABM3L549_CUCME|nr:amino acid permease 3-like [Cucumis melo]